ncbi:hypothetical protein BDL97_17G108100 [Sphagnum fallax]|nr:hypothetical protein BDL97_17G108100 [Sphagnum fallax]
MQTAVHQLWPPPGDLRKTEMNILFFHEYPRDPDEWKSAWTQRSHPDVCWPEKWLPADLGFDARVLFVSYGESSVADVVDDLFKALIIRDEWDLCKNRQPLVLVGRGFGTKVLDEFFLKAMKEVITSSTAFVRNVRGVTLYANDFESYKIEKFFGAKSEDIERARAGISRISLRDGVLITQGSMLINPTIDGKNLTRHVVGMDPCQWIKEVVFEADWDAWDPEVRWKPESKQSPGYNLLLESCRKVYQFEAIRAIFEHLQQKLDNIITACGISNYSDSDSDFKDEFTYLRHNGIEGAKILIVQRMLATMGVDVEQHMVAKKSDDGEQLENERKLAILKFTVARFCENHEWHMVPEMRESDMQQKIKSSLNDVVDGIPPLSDDIMNEEMHGKLGRKFYLSGRKAFRRDGNDTVPIHFPSIRKQSTMSVKQLQQLACNMRPGKNLPQEDVQEQLTAYMAQVLHGGKLIVTAKILEGKIQFLFGNAISMAQIVGVGLDFATVSLTRQNVIVVKGITELEWTRLWGEVFLGESLFENPIFMEKVLAKSVNDPSTGILGFNLWDYFSRLQITRGIGSSTRDTSGEGVSHLGGTDTPSEGDKDQGGDGGEDDDNRKGRGAKGKEIQQNNQWDLPSTGILGFDWWHYPSWLQIPRGLGSSTRDISGEEGSHLAGRDTPNEGDKDQGADGGEDDDNHKGRGAKGKEIQQNNQRNLPSTGILGFNWWYYPSWLQILRGLGSSTRDTSGEGGSHLGGRDTPNEADKDQGGDGGEDDDNHKGRGAKGKEIQQNNQRDLPSTGILGFNWWHYPSWLQTPRGFGSATKDTSGEGGSHLGGRGTPNEGDKDESGDGGEDDDDGGEDNDDRKGRGAKGKKIQQNNQRDVHVTVETGCEHGVWNRNPVPVQPEGSDIDPIPEQLKKSYIDPTLEFVFKKAESTIESNVLVKCCMNEKRRHRGSERFGWFQYKLHVSFQCKKRYAAKPSKSELLGSQTLKTSYMEQKQTNPFQFKLKATGGAPGIANVQTSMSKSLASTSKQTVSEMEYEFISGTRFCANCTDKGGSRPKSRYMFKLWPKVPTNKLPNKSDKVKHTGMLSTVSPNFKANWSVKRQVICKYELKVKRHACELVLVAGKPKTWWGQWKQNLSCDRNKMLQTYRVTLYINHKMSNIETLAEFERPLWKDNPKNKLVGLGVRPSSPASDEGSSNTE